MAFKKNNEQSLLIIFYKNPELGKVKTRLAATIGDAKAFSIYLLLSEHTMSITQNLGVTKALYYSNHIDQNDGWPNDKYHKYVQVGSDLGERMENAFNNGFAIGFRSVCIIGTDCLELKSSIINEAFRRLLTHDVVIGPANDGGYYLLGMNYLHNALFRNKTWSTDRVLSDTLHDVNLQGLSCWQLQQLCDIDEEKDLPLHFRI